MLRSMRSLSSFVVATIVTVSALWLYAADQTPSQKSARPEAKTVDLFAGIDSGALKVKYIPKNDREAQVLIENTTKQPVSVQLPDAFVGVPVLAQVATAAATQYESKQ